MLRLAARSSQSNPRGSGPEVLKRDWGHMTPESGVMEVGVFRALQPNAAIWYCRSVIMNKPSGRLLPFENSFWELARCRVTRHLHNKKILSIFNLMKTHIGPSPNVMKHQPVILKSFQYLGINSLWPGDTIWRHRSGSTLVQVMACCLMAPSHYLNQCWLIISEVCDNHLRAISQEIPRPSITKITLKYACIKFH